MGVLVALGTLDPAFPPLTCCWSQREKPRVRQYFQTQNTSLLTVIMTLDLEEISPEKQNSLDRKSTRLNSSHIATSRMPSSA